MLSHTCISTIFCANQVTCGFGRWVKILIKIYNKVCLYNFSLLLLTIPYPPKLIFSTCQSCQWRNRLPLYCDLDFCSLVIGKNTVLSSKATYSLDANGIIFIVIRVLKTSWLSWNSSRLRYTQANHLAINIILESESENEINDLNVDIKPKKKHSYFKISLTRKLIIWLVDRLLSDLRTAANIYSYKGRKHLNATWQAWRVG